MNDDSTNAQAAHAAAAFAGFLMAFIGLWAIFVFVLLAFIIYLVWRVAEKAGYQGAWSLLYLVPLGNLVLLILFAFSEWPVQVEVRRLRAQVRAAQLGQTSQPPLPTA